MNSLILRSGAKMPSIGFGTFVGGKNSADAYKGSRDEQNKIYLINDSDLV